MVLVVVSIYMVKYLHIRRLDENNLISPHGGLTIAYTCTLTEICMATAMCHDNDLFCYDIARRIARGRLQSVKVETTVIPLTHPITQAIVDWVSLEWFDVPISIFLDPKRRWVSDFQPDDGVAVVDTDWQDQLEPSAIAQFHEVKSDDGCWINGEMRYDG